LTRQILSNRIPEIKQTDAEKKAKRRDLIRSLFSYIPFGRIGYDVVEYVKASTLSTKQDIDKDLLRPEDVEEIVQKCKIPRIHRRVFIR
jgi:hypothetical protein